jgi:hypothetical protein
MLRPYLKIWDWDLIFGRAVKAIFSPGVRSPWDQPSSTVSDAISTGLYMFCLLAYMEEKKEE